MQLNFIMNTPGFYLRNFSALDVTDEHEIFIMNPRLDVKRLVSNPSYFAALQKLSEETCKYHIERAITRAYNIPERTQATCIANVRIGALANVVFVAFVESDAFHGSKNSNPFQFQHFGINHLCVEPEGISFPTKPYQISTSNAQWIEPYSGPYEVLQKRHMNWGELPFSY